MNFNYFFKLSIGILITLKLSMAQDVVVSLGEPTIISNPGVPIYPWFPDGHISLIKDGDQNQMYWAGSTSYRTLGQDVSTMKSPAIAVLSKGAKGDIDYTNPFNPETRIQFSIHEQQFVTLKIFDSLGKYIETLVNEFKSSESIQ